MKQKLSALIAILMPIFAFAEDKLNSGDTAWMMVSTAFVLLMTPAGLALFYAGMTRSKNTLNTFSMVMGAFILAFVVWVVAGYSLAFGTNSSAMLQNVVGGFEHLLLSGISWSDLSGTYPTYVFITFQGTFAAITVAIASGSVIGRMKFSTWMVIVALWGVLVYAPIVHMVWGGKGALLFDAGALDFAGGTVVHMNGGLAGLVLALLVGRRTGYPKVAMKPFSIILTALGAALLWFGWYGFNGGSAFGANAIAGLAVLTTTVATAAAAVTWMLIEWVVFKKPTLLGIASGIIAGLVAITPAAGFVSVGGAFVIGIVGSLIAFWGVVSLKKMVGYDDSLDAFGIHFLAGLWGALATGLLALNDQKLLWDGPMKAEGDRMAQFFVQVESVVVVGLWTLIGTVVVYFIAKAVTGGARVDEETEEIGLDKAIHGEKAMNL
ncbi:ammonium transporter [Sulfurovum sp.]|jgi:Amt family ammonium transporter|uniref:ammonium transporter n=1 Tax=Sulfurovum sp. TaxID=1969726 RepID=UPI002A36B6FA|nr:ammonium transporter [Sulfurovum sp.]MDD2451397.1 ammonium transporter [Sulfurovum sp.]MDD3500583.1 ammonium transporter [Sulfurovum sp.]MDY0402975.1 ammonium transporter [Sulfurovum sp.]